MFDRSAKFAFLIACLTLVVGRVGFQIAANALNIYFQKEPVELRSKFPTIPDRIGEWKRQGDDRVIDKAEVEELGTQEYLDRVYVGAGSSTSSRGQTLMVHVSYYTGMIDAVPHVPDRCLVAAGFDAQSLPENVPLRLDTSEWKLDADHINRKTNAPYPYVMYQHHFTGQKVMLRMPLVSGGGAMGFRTTEFGRRDQPNTRVYAGYMFIANGCATPQPESIRLLAFDRTDKYAYYCKVQCLMSGPRDFTREKFIQVVSEFMSDFLPELMRCLPDWAEVEASEQPKAASSTPTGASRSQR